ncbi:MAG: ATP-binding protein [Candidatus Krumholzibacteriia bacterium]
MVNADVAGSHWLTVLLAAGLAVALMIAAVAVRRSRRAVARRDDLQRLLEVRERQLAAATSDPEGMRSQLARHERLATMGLLLAGLAHELNTPISAVSCTCETLRRVLARLGELAGRDTLDEAGMDELRQTLAAAAATDEIIEDALGRIQELVRSLRLSVRGDSSRFAPYDVNAGVDSALLLLQNQLKHGIELERDLGDVPLIHAVPAQMNQVLLNLLLNARQAIPESGRIRVSTRADHEGVTVAVSDTGTGISPENLERIFDPDFTTKPPESGTGLGLAICRTVVAGHGGDIQVESRPGVGSTFTVQLPLEPPAAASAPGRGE